MLPSWASPSALVSNKVECRIGLLLSKILLLHEAGGCNRRARTCGRSCLGERKIAPGDICSEKHTDRLSHERREHPLLFITDQPVPLWQPPTVATPFLSLPWAQHQAGCVCSGRCRWAHCRHCCRLTRGSWAAHAGHPPLLPAHPAPQPAAAAAAAAAAAHPKRRWQPPAAPRPQSAAVRLATTAIMGKVKQARHRYTTTMHQHGASPVHTLPCLQGWTFVPTWLTSSCSISWCSRRSWCTSPRTCKQQEEHGRARYAAHCTGMCGPCTSQRVSSC